MKINNLIGIQETSNITNTTDLPYIYVTKFDQESFNNFYKSFVDLNSNPKVKTIVIVINSYGGQVYSLLAMIDVIRSSLKPVCTIGTGCAMSCGAVLLSCGTKGYRYVSNEAIIMIHEASSMDYGKTADIEVGTKHLRHLNKKVLSILENNSNIKKNSLQSLIRSKGNVDWYLESKETKRLGLVDHIGFPTFYKK